MIDKRVKSYIRTRNGQAFFQYVERFDSVEKAADPSNEGELVEVKVSEIKWDFTKVKANKLKVESYNLHLQVAECREQLMANR
jgi:hypothetical protein